LLIIKALFQEGFFGEYQIEQMNKEKGPGNREQGTGDKGQGTGNREQGTRNRVQGKME